MIEQFKNIDFFKPNVFEILAQDNVKMMKFLQDFVDFLYKEMDIKDKYTIKFSDDIGSDIGRFRHYEKSVLLNKEIYNLYKQYIKDPTQISNRLASKLNKYSFQIYSTLVHEICHSKQFEQYTKEHDETYKNTTFPITNNMLYPLQKTEREAYLLEIKYVEELYNYYKYNNLLTTTESSNLNDYINDLKDDINALFKDSLELMVSNKIIKEKDIQEVNINNFEDNIKIYETIQKLIERETLFVEERNDHIINKTDYLIKDVDIDNNHALNYKIKNDNGKWNIYLELYNKQKKNPNPNNNPQFGFVLDGNELRINISSLYINDNIKLNEKEILKYANAFISKYHTNITKVRISNFAYNIDYKQTKQFIKQNKIFNFFKIKPKIFTKQEYEDAQIKIDRSLSLTDIINLNEIKKCNTHKVIHISR